MSQRNWGVCEPGMHPKGICNSLVNWGTQPKSWPYGCRLATYSRWVMTEPAGLFTKPWLAWAVTENLSFYPYFAAFVQFWKAVNQIRVIIPEISPKSAYTAHSWHGFHFFALFSEPPHVGEHQDGADNTLRAKGESCKDAICLHPHNPITCYWL